MNRLTLNNSDLSVFPIALGSTAFGCDISDEETFAILDAYLEKGGNFIDTANVYGSFKPGHKSESEKVIGRWMKARGNRGKIVLATKGAHFDVKTTEKRVNRAAIESDLAESLTHLGVNEIDLYWLHRDDRSKTVAELIDTLEDAVKAGKIRYYGLSNWTCERLAEALEYSKARSGRLIASQIRWSLAVPSRKTLFPDDVIAMDSEINAFHKASGLVQIPYSSQAKGYFAKRATGAEVPEKLKGAYGNPESERRFAALSEISAKTGVSVTALSLVFFTQRPYQAIPIIGAKNLPHLNSSLEAVTAKLDDESLAVLRSFEY